MKPKQDIAAFWQQRYDRDEYVYGTRPNDFLVAESSRLPANARVLSLGEGEGRNAAHLAGLGHRVTALEVAPAGVRKIAELASQLGVAVETVEADLTDYQMEPGHWQAIVSIFCHLPPAVRRQTLAQAVQGLCPGGWLLLEGYTPRQLAYGTGGPREAELLLDPEEIRSELDGLELVRFGEITRVVHEGLYHNGRSAVLQVVARKPD